MKRKSILTVALLLCIVGVIAIIVYTTSSKDSTSNQAASAQARVRDNVTVLTEDTEASLQPIQVNNDNLIYNSDPHYQTGEIVVAGIIDAAPYGFIRKVVNTAEDGKRYIVATEPAVLTDVFEEAHIVKCFELTNGGAAEFDPDAIRNESNKAANLKQLGHVNETGSYQNLASTSQQAKDKTYHLDSNSTKGFAVDGDVSTDLWVEVKIDITPSANSSSSIEFSVILHNKTNGDYKIGYSAEASAEFEKRLFDSNSVNCFYAGGIPIVITNEITANFEGSSSISGYIGMNYAMKSSTSTGFSYSSLTNKVTEINEKEFESDGINWSTGSEFKGDATSGVFAHLITKLYDSTGMDLSAGAEGEIEGNVSADTSGNYSGSLDISICPKIEGKIVVSVPIIDKVLAEKTIFTVALEPWWEKHWKSDGPANSGQSNTYITKYGTANKLTYPAFAFDYPENWKISSADVSQKEELVTLTNERGATVTFLHLNEEPGGYSGVTMYKIDVSKVADSSFVPDYVQDKDLSYLGKFMVAKLHPIAYLNMKTDSDYTAWDGGVEYAVLPESDIGLREDVRMPSSGEFTFDYCGYISFVCSPPEGGFSDEETKDAIAILSSFRVAN